MTKTLITKKALQCQINEDIQRKNPSRNRRRRLNENMTLDEAYGMLGDFIESQRSTISNALSKYGFEPDFDFNAEDGISYIELIPTNKHIKDNFEDIILYMNFITDIESVPDNSDLSDARMKLYATYQPYGSNKYTLKNTNKYQCTVPEIPKIISLILRDLNRILILVGKSIDPFNQGDFKIIDNTLVIYKGSDSNVTIPDGVKSIGDYAFNGCTGLKSIIIPNSVTEIGYEAFDDCESLTSVTIGNSVTYIGEGAFNNCISLKSIKIPNSVTEIGKSAYGGCKNLVSITIPNSVTEIGKSAFGGCKNLVSITIPNSVTRIGKDAFDDCNNLTDIKIPDRFTDEDTLKEIGLNDKQIDNLLDNYTWD
jgi:hypothetical protein